MATSGSMAGNGFGGGRFYHTNWQLGSQEIGNNRSLIHWQSYAHFTNSDSQLDNGYTNSSAGMLWQNGGRVKNYTGVVNGERNVGLASSSFWIGHDGAGNCSFFLSGGITFYGYGRSENGGTWWGLPTIPRNANITGADNFDDTGNPRITYSNPAGHNLSTLKASIHNTAGSVAYVPYRDVDKGGDSYTFNLTQGERDALLSATPNSNTMAVNFYLWSIIGGVDSRPALTRTFTVTNANPIYTTTTYKDVNSATTAITGDNQYIIQGHSSLEVGLSSANKALPQKFATMSRYIVNVAGVSSEVTYSTSDMVKNMGAINQSTNQTLTVTARDSRGNQTAVSKPVSVVPYSAPTLIATAVRQNNFEATTNVHIEGDISLLTIGGTNKNAVNTSSGVAYRYRETGGTWGAWTNRTSSTNSSTGKVTTTDFQLTLDNSKTYEFEFRITDKLNTATLPVNVPAGIAIMRISTTGDDLIYNKEQPLMPSHVGQIIMSATLDTAAKVQAIYGGMWVAWGVGRVPVGYAPGDADFGTVEATGGSKTVTLSVNQIPKHSHQTVDRVMRDMGQQNVWGNAFSQPAGYASSATYAITNSVGNDQPHSNIQPSQTLLFWKRTV